MTAEHRGRLRRIDEREEPPPPGDEDAPPILQPPPELAAQYIFVRNQNRYVRRTSGDAISREALDASHTRDIGESEVWVPNGKSGRRRVKRAHEVVDFYADQADDLGWWPGKPELYDYQGRRLVNSFRAPATPPAVVAEPTLWLEHLRWLLPDADQVRHLLDVLAYNVQHLDGKVNHAIVLGGGLGIGKDLMLEPVRRWLKSAGAWKDAKTEDLDGQFTEYLHRAKVLCVQESRDLSFETGFHRYNSLKTVIAAPPDDLTIKVKYLRDFSVPNLVQVIILTNYENGVYFEDKDDRRYFVLWSDVAKAAPDYYAALAGWIEAHYMDVVGWLAQRDLTHFKPKAPPPDTCAREAMHTATRSGAELTLVEVADELLTEKSVFTRGDLTQKAKAIGHRALETLLDNRVRAGKALRDLGIDRGELRLHGKLLTIYWRRDALSADQARAEFRRRNPGWGEPHGASDVR